MCVCEIQILDIEHGLYRLRSRQVSKSRELYKTSKQGLYCHLWPYHTECPSGSTVPVLAVFFFPLFSSVLSLSLSLSLSLFSSLSLLSLPPLSLSLDNKTLLLSAHIHIQQKKGGLKFWLVKQFLNWHWESFLIIPLCFNFLAFALATHCLLLIFLNHQWEKVHQALSGVKIAVDLLGLQCCLPP